MDPMQKVPQRGVSGRFGASPGLSRRWLGQRLMASALGAFLVERLGAQGLAPASAAALPDLPPWWGSARVVLFRHALAPGGGDPPGFRLDDCASQRNLSAEGRAQAERIGAWFWARALPVDQVWHSRWCRTRDTARLAFGALARPEPVFDSFFAATEREAPQTIAARALLQGWQGPGLLVVVTHQVNITALTGVWPASGEGTVLGANLRVLGRIQP